MDGRIFKDAKVEADFRREGYAILDLLTKKDIAQLTSFYEQFDFCHQDDFSTTVLTEEFEARKRVHDRISAIFRRRLLPALYNYRIILASYAVKLPQTQYSRVGAHQDFSFVNEESHVGLSIWCPLVEVNEENGWLGVLRGSQDFNSNLREACPLPYPDLRDVIEEKYLTYLPMRPGQALLMDNRVFHASTENRTERTRLVAAGIAVPESSQILYCHYDEPASEGYLEVYEVPEDFYLRHIITTRPREGSRIAEVPRIVSHLTEEMIKARQAELAQA